MKQKSILMAITKRFSVHRLVRLGITVAVLACLLFPSVAVKLVHAQNPTDLIYPCDFDGIILGPGDTPPLGNTVQDYNLTDNWGGTWCDAEKTYADTDDDLMCWAAAASNVLEWTGWGFVHHSIEGEMTNCDQMFEHFNDHWEDQGSLTNIGWMWWFNGVAGLPGDYPNDPPYNGGPASWSEVDVPGGGDFWDPPYVLSDYYHSYSGAETLQHIDEYLRAGYGVALGIYNGGHAITCWGFRYDDAYDPATEPENHYLGLYITDSDDYDLTDTIRYYTVSYNAGISRWEFDTYGGGGWHIEHVFALEKNTFLEPDLAIYKTAYPNVVMAGEELFYNITVVNENTIVGGVTAYNVVVTDTLPIGVTYINDTGGLVHVGGTTYRCNLGDIAPGDSRSFTIKVWVYPGYVITHGDTITDTATVTSDTQDWESDLTNNEATVTTYVQEEADLKVIKLCKPDTRVLAGEVINYTIIVDNLGPSCARGVLIKDTILSSGTFTLVSITSSLPATLATPLGEYHDVTIYGLLTDWLEPQNIPLLVEHGRWIVRVTVRANEALDINDDVSVFTTPDGTPDPDMSNNQAEQSIDVNAVADLQMHYNPAYPGKTDSSDPVYTGESFKYTLIVTNTGPSTAVNVVVKDWMPAGLSINNATPSEGWWNAGVPGDPSRPTTWFIGSMPAGRTETMTINVTVLKPADLSLLNWTIHNDAMVFSDTLDLDNSDNLATEDTTVINTFFLADLKVIKFVKPDTTVLAGENITYTIIVENLGPSYAYHVCIRDEILSSDNFTIVDIDLDPVRLDTGAFVTTSPKGGVTYEVILLDPLEPKNTNGGGRWFVQITVRANETQDINNLVNVFSSDIIHWVDPDLSNNEAQCSIHVTAVADLEITKTDNPDPVVTQQSCALTYTLVVTNHGPSTAVNVFVEDLLPAGLTIKNISVTIGSFNAGVPGDPSRPTIWAIDSLAPGASGTMTIKVTMPQNIEPHIKRNDARVSSNTLDIDNSNNMASQDTKCVHYIGQLPQLAKVLNPVDNQYLSLAAIGLISLASLISSIAAISIFKRRAVRQFIGFLKAKKQ